jgi:transcriptional regulator with XRE-family HTH domain
MVSSSKIKQVKDKDLQKLGLKIQSLREKRGFNRDVFAREAGVSKHYLYRLEYGNANPSVLQLRKLAKCLKVSVKEMIDF